MISNSSIEPKSAVIQPTSAPASYKGTLNKSSTSDAFRNKKALGGPVKSPESQQKYNARKISRQIFKLSVEAIEEFHMIQDGDKVLLGLSGGKDSLTLLHILLDLQVFTLMVSVFTIR